MANDLQTLRVYSKDNEGLSMTIRDGVVVVARPDTEDKNQYWFKDTSKSKTVKDAEGYPAFCIINKGTGEALKHSGSSQPVGLIKYDPNNVDNSTLWTQTADLGDGFHFIRKVDDVKLVLDGEFGGIKDGTRVIEYPQKPEDWGTNNQRWRLDLYPEQTISTVRLQSFGALLSSVGIRDGVAVMVPDDSYDALQHWIVDKRYSYEVDKDGNPGFALSNRVTGQFLQHVKDGSNYKVQLAHADPNRLTEPFLWTLGSTDFGQGYRNIRVINDISTTLLFQRNSGEADGASLVIGNDQSSKDSMWKINSR